MDPQAYEAFTQTLLDTLKQDPAVTGLVALGSMARQGVDPDRWSDHDFFVITEPGEQERFRTAPGWLPGAERIVLHHRETEHGVKALYEDGHLVEFAVFDLEELRVARVNRYRVLLDRGGVAAALAQVAEATASGARSGESSDAWLVAQFLTNLLVGWGRLERGERLSGRQFVESHALQHLLRLLARHIPADGAGGLDNLDPFRRFEAAYPELGREIDSLLAAPLHATVCGLLDLADRELSPRLVDYPKAAAAAVRRRLAV